MSIVRLLLLAWWLQLKMRSRSAFDGLLSLLYPLFFATSIFLMYRQSDTAGPALVAAAIGSSAMGIWSAVSTTAAFSLQSERRHGTLELLVIAPRPFALLIAPMTLSMASIGAYSMVTTLLWGRFVFGIPLVVRNVPLFLLAVLVTVISIGMLGYLIALCSIRYRSAWALGSAIEMPVWLICGFIVAVTDLPVWIRPLSWVLAPTWGMEALQASAAGDDPWLALGLCLLLAGAYAVTGIGLAKRLVDSARVNATLALS
jgi:ABC-2 type transport system permease protein